MSGFHPRDSGLIGIGCEKLPQGDSNMRQILSTTGLS